MQDTWPACPIRLFPATSQWAFCAKSAAAWLIPMTADFAKAMRARFWMCMEHAVCAGIARWQKQAHAVRRGKSMGSPMGWQMVWRVGGPNRFILSRRRAVLAWKEFSRRALLPGGG